MFKAYESFESWLQTQHGTPIKHLCSDHGGEHLSDKFTCHLKVKGTEQKLTTYDMPEHNGVAKRLNCTLVECVCTVLHVSGLPKFLWGEVLLHTVWVKNRSATRVLDGKTLYKMLYGKKPYLGDLPIWGAKCWILDHSGSKLDDCACEGHWVGFDTELTAHWIYLPNKHTVVIEHNVTFQKVNELVLITVSEPLATNRNTTMNLPVPPAPHAMSNTPAQSKLPIPPKPSHLGLTFVNKPPEDVLCRLSCQHTESAYLQLLRTGQGTHCYGPIPRDYNSMDLVNFSLLLSYLIISDFEP